MVQTWETTFMNLAKQLAKDRSTCERLKVGCLLVNEDNRLIGTGHNGHLNGGLVQTIVRDNHEQATVHAEINALSNCARLGVSSLNCTAYVTHYPCINCAKALWQAGVKKVVYETEYKVDELIAQIIPDSDYIVPSSSSKSS